MLLAGFMGPRVPSSRESCRNEITEMLPKWEQGPKGEQYSPSTFLEQGALDQVGEY